jgi:hypothetical protein
MKKRIFCIASLVLVACALWPDLIAKRQFIENANLRPAALHSRSMGVEQKKQLRILSDQIERRGRTFACISLCLAVSGLVCLAVSFRRHEPAWWRSASVALSAFYLCMVLQLAFI